MFISNDRLKEFLSKAFDEGYHGFYDLKNDVIERLLEEFFTSEFQSGYKINQDKIKENEKAK